MPIQETVIERLINDLIRIESDNNEDNDKLKKNIEMLKTKKADIIEKFYAVKNYYTANTIDDEMSHLIDQLPGSNSSYIKGGLLNNYKLIKMIMRVTSYEIVAFRASLEPIKNILDILEKLAKNDEKKNAVNAVKEIYNGVFDLTLADEIPKNLENKIESLLELVDRLADDFNRYDERSRDFINQELLPGIRTYNIKIFEGRLNSTLRIFVESNKNLKIQIKIIEEEEREYTRFCNFLSFLAVGIKTVLFIFGWSPTP